MIRTTQESFEAKAKGEKNQQELADRLREAFPQHADSIRSTPMSAHGEDIQILTPEARKDIPFSFRFSILVARRIYRKIGHKILDKKNLENYQNAGKIYVSNLEKGLETFLSILDLIQLSLMHKKDDQVRHNHILINEEININERI